MAEDAKAEVKVAAKKETTPPTMLELMAAAKKIDDNVRKEQAKATLLALKAQAGES